MPLAPTGTLTCAAYADPVKALPATSMALNRATARRRKSNTEEFTALISIMRDMCDVCRYRSSLCHAKVACNSSHLRMVLGIGRFSIKIIH